MQQRTAQWNTPIEHVAALGESPFWHPHEQMLYWVDIPAHEILRANVFVGTVQRWQVPSEPGCIAPAAGGGWVMALRDGIYRAHVWGQAPTLLARFNHDPLTTRFNDGKADPMGRFWAGTMYEPRDARKAELFSVDCRPEQVAGDLPLVDLKAQNGVIANGLAFSPGNDTVYWSDTTHHVIQAWDWNADTNAMTHHRVFQQFPPKPSGWQPDAPDASNYGGRPDGAAVDVQGNYWVAMYEGGRLLQFSPDGQLLADYAVPARCPTMPCFGGDDLRTLYLTTASQGRSAAELAKYPESGRVLSMRVEVPGLPVNFFRD